jgi:branched-chain amino acid transport system permease protein
LQAWSGGRLDASILRQLLIALAMIGIMLSRPRGLWPSPEHGQDVTPDTLPVNPHAKLAAAEQIPPPATSIKPAE